MTGLVCLSPLVSVSDYRRPNFFFFFFAFFECYMEPNILAMVKAEKRSRI